MKVLVYTSPARGHLYPIMAGLLELARRGHEVHVKTLASEVERLRASGLSAAPIAPSIEARLLDDYAARSAIGGHGRAVTTFLDRGELELEDMGSAIESSRPDVCLVDTNTWGAQAVAEARGLPLAVWHPFPLPYPSRHTPPFGLGLPPARGWPGRLRDRALRPLALASFERFRGRLNTLRRRAGAPELERLMSLYLRPQALLHMSAEPFEYPRSDWPRNVHLVGPGLWSPPGPVPALPSDRPVLLVTCSTEFQDDGALVEHALAAFGDDPRFTLVATTAGVDPSHFAAPSGAVVTRFASHADLLKRAVGVICHGGMGIVQRALASGVPVCAVPFGRDQFEVARRVAASGAGVSLGRSQLSATRLRAAVERTLTCRPGAEAVARAFAAAGGAPRIAEVIEGLGR